MDPTQYTKKVKFLSSLWFSIDPTLRISILIAGALLFSILAFTIADSHEPVEEYTEEAASLVTEDDSDDSDAGADITKPTEDALEELDTVKPLKFTTTIKPGDSLSSIFDQNDINTNDLWLVMELAEVKKNLAHLKPQEAIQFELDEHRHLQHMTMKLDQGKILHVTRPAPHFEARIEETPPESRLTRAIGTVKSSLYQATHSANIPDKITGQLTEIFANQLNLAKDVHAGDKFTIVYKTSYVNNKRVNVGDIMAASIQIKGKTYTAVRYAPKNGTPRYYTPEGKSLQNSFLRAPVNYKRVSSPYNPQRMHPILHIKRPHRGVDLSAPSGTPVRSIGDGKVTFTGYKGGYGNVVTIHHGNQVVTLYAHLKRVAPGLVHGKQVEKGQIIGYVGSTGLASGPHLHYEYRINGKPYNPMTVKFPSGYSLPRTQLAKFKAIAQPLLAELSGSPTKLAAKVGEGTKAA